MKHRQLDRLNALQRLRKLKEDQERMRLIESLRRKQRAEDACDAGEHKLEGLGDRSKELAATGNLVDMTRYIFLRERLQAESDTQIVLVEAKASSESHLQEAVMHTADAWKNHTAVSRKRRRIHDEMLREQETRDMEEHIDLWLARRRGHRP